MRKVRVISVYALVVLLALGIDLMGRGVANAAVTGQQAPMVVMNGAAPGGGCGVCNTQDETGAPPSGCVTGACWNLPASSGSSLLLELYGSGLFSLEAYDLGAGISGGPDPHPPRSPFRI